MTEIYVKHCKDLEMRLRRYKQICARITSNKHDIDELRDMNHEALLRSSKSVVKLIGNGQRHDPIETFEKQIGMLKSFVRADEHEVREIRKALRTVRDDPYYYSIEYKYFKGMTDEQSSRELKCSLSTLRRNRERLLITVAAVLYGRA